MGDSNEQAPTQTTTYQLSPEQRQLMQLAMPGVREFAASPLTRFPGSGVAGFDPSQTAGQNAVLGSAGAQAGLASGGAGLSNFWLRPDVWDPAQNSMLSSAIGAATRPIWEGLTEEALPRIRGEAISTGGFGGSRQGVAEGLATRGAARAAGDVGARMASDLYSTNVKAQLQALGLLPQTQTAQATPGLTTSAVGDVRQALAQRMLDDQIAGFNFEQYAPFLQSREIMSLLQGLPGGSTVSTGSVPPAPGMGTQALGGALAGASLGSTFGPVGAGVGAGAGALLPFLLA